MAEPFRVGISPDFKVAAPGSLEPVLAQIFDPLPQLTYEFFPMAGTEVRPEEVAEFDAVLALAPRFTPGSFSGRDRLGLIARWGVGYDMIHLPSCTAADVLLAITVDAVRKPVAEAVVLFILALAKKMVAKDRLVRRGRWDLKAGISGLNLNGKVVGSVGIGNIGGEMFRLLGPFDLARRLAYDPYIDPARAAALDVELVDLPTLFREADFVAVNCPLTADTEGLVNADLLGLMQPTAYFINTARGPIVNQADLTAALQAGTIAGAALDVFDQEPLPADHPLVAMENVILTPHAIAWTADLYRDNGLGACENILTFCQGQVPRYTVNPTVTQRPGFQARLAANRERWAQLSR